jgi:hypothetical protein
MFLSPEEVSELTGRKRVSDQLTALKMMRVPHLINAIGRPIIVRDNLMGKTAAKPIEKWKPNP